MAARFSLPVIRQAPRGVRQGGLPRRVSRALVPVLGSKLRLLPAISKALESVGPSNTSGSIFVDPFLGGGAVSLWAKALGFTVHSNDIATRSLIVGKALIENSETHLSRLDLLPLFEHPPDRDVERRAAKFLAPRQARFLASALPAAANADGHLKWLLQLTIEKWLLRAIPMSLPSASDASDAAALDLDVISPNRVAHYLRGQASVRPSVVWQIAQAVNGGVLPGTGFATQLDAVEFLASQRGDVVYLDPPYAGTTRYESAYALLDQLLGDPLLDHGDYSSMAAPIGELLDAAESFPIWLISFAGERSEDLLELVRARRSSFKAHRIPFRHLASLSPSRRIYEYVIVATI